MDIVNKLETTNKDNNKSPIANAQLNQHLQTIVNFIVDRIMEDQQNGNLRSKNVANNYNE